MPSSTYSGPEAVAVSLFRQGVSVMTGYPGSPVTGVMESYKHIVAGLKGYQAIWTINEKVAYEYALGFSVTGLRTAVTVKNVGFNLIMDSLVISGLTGVNGACIIVLGDDPGSLNSSHEQDSRALAVAAEVPLFEPSDPQQAPDIVQQAIFVSEEYRIPVVIRFTPNFVTAKAEIDFPGPRSSPCPRFRRSSEITGSACMPDYAVALHKRVHQVKEKLKQNCLAGIEKGQGELGLIAVGDSWLKVEDVLKRIDRKEIKTFCLEQVNPLPQSSLLPFLQEIKRILVVEEGQPLAEEKILALSQTHGLDIHIMGKLSHDLPGQDLLYLHDIYKATTNLGQGDIDEDLYSDFFQEPKIWAGGKPLCQGCPYGRIYEALSRYWRDKKIYEPALATEPGCGVRLKYEPYNKVDLKFCMGSASPVVSAISQVYTGERPVAMIGDSAFLNSGVPGLIQACHLQSRILIIIVNNYSAALTGYQPTLESGPEETKVVLTNLIKGIGPEFFTTIDEEEFGRLREVFDQAHAAQGTSVILVNAPCPE